MHQHKQHGFTLIELAITLVIIGLLVGGVVVGRDLIKSAEIRHAVSNLEKITVAVNTFKLKYNCIPGDCANGTDYGFTNNGNGNGMIEWSNESVYALQALLAANLISEQMYWAPYLKANDNGFGYLYYKDLYSVTNRTGVTLSWFGNGGFSNSSTCGQVNTSTLSPNTAHLIDEKIDNGLPRTGNFLAFDGKVKQIPDCPAVAPLPTCVDTGGANIYQNSDVIGCRTVYFLQGN